MNGDGQLEALGRLDALLEREGIAYWVFGGWAVDFHAGRVTREHADIDLAVWRTDLDRIRRLFGVEGWVHTPAPDEDGFTTYAHDGVHVDLAFLARDEHGTVYTPLRSGRGEWPPDAFGTDVCALAGTRVHVVSMDSLIADKSAPREDPVTATKDAADVTVLRSARSARR